MLATMPKLSAFAMSLCRNRDQAEDLVQQTFLRACANIQRFEPGTNMAAWLFTILRNQFYSDCRQRRVFEPVEDYADAICQEPGQLRQIEYAELQLAMTKLRAQERDALILVAVQGLSYNAAARASQCAVGTIKSRLHRARARLTELLSMTCVPAPDSVLVETAMD